MTQQEKQEQQTIEKLKAQKNSVRPSRELLSKIIAQLPASPADRPAQEELQAFPTIKKQHTNIAWIRFAIPAGVITLLFGIFFFSQFSQMPSLPSSPIANLDNTQPIVHSVIPDIPPEKSLSLAAIAQEEQQIDQELTFESFFADEDQMLEIDTALANF